MAKKSKLGLGLLLGAVGGALAAILYAPQSGKETREEAAKKIKDLKGKFSDAEIEKKVKAIYGKVTDETKNLYVSASKEVVERAAELKKRVGRIDAAKYQKLVDDVVDDYKDSVKNSGKALKLLRTNLAADWRKLVDSGKTKKSSSKANGKRAKSK